MNRQSYHFIGIGGIGMSALARLLAKGNHIVSGSDSSKSEITDQLIELGVKVAIGQRAENLPQGATVIYSSGISDSNPELKAAKTQGYPLMHRSDLLQSISLQSKLLAIAGTHGKTTTTSLLTSLLIKAKWSPSYMIGGILNETKVNAAKGEGEYFVAEADESDGTFLKYQPFGAIVTNIDLDHMDYYKTDERLTSAFLQFLNQVKEPSLRFYCRDDARLKGLNVEGVSYGFNQPSVLQGSNFRQKGSRIIFDVNFKGKKYLDVTLSALGKHNGYNGLAVFGMGIALGISEDVIREAFLDFKGVARRVQKIGEAFEITLFDDYGHHPTEIETTIKGLKKAFPNRKLKVLFQPHRYTRTEYCLKEFGKCFDFADELIVTDIYGAGEALIDGVNPDAIIKEIKKNSTLAVEYLPFDRIVESVFSKARPFDLILTLGAGSITTLGPILLQKLLKAPPKPLSLGIIFGGVSVEHEISLRSAKNVAAGFNKELYSLTYFYISKSGEWLTGKRAENALKEGPLLSGGRHAISREVLEALKSCEFIFPVLHGPNGEDGKVQGFLDLLNIPFAGNSANSCSVCMDKAVTKKLAEATGIDVTPSVDLTFDAWNDDQEASLSKITTKLQAPFYVKPVHLGSAVAVYRVEDEKGLKEAIDKAFKFDTILLIEEEVIGREIEFTVFGLGAITVFPPGEIPTNGTTYTYDAKYGQNGLKAIVQADLPQELIEQGMDLAKRAYLAALCDGFARVDFFLCRNGKYLLNEINPIPGFTSISLFPMMANANGLATENLLNELVLWGQEKFLRQKRLFLEGF